MGLSALPRVLTINGGSSTIKFAVLAGRERLLSGHVERIGEPGTELRAGVPAVRVIPADEEPVVAGIVLDFVRR